MTYGGDTYGGSALGSTTEDVDKTVSRTTARTLVSTSGTAVAQADTQTSASATTTSAGAAVTTATAQTTATTVAVDATLIEPAVEWRVTRDETVVEDSVFDVDPVVDTANPFGDYCVIKMDDRGGTLFEEYERGTRVDVAVSENFGITFENRFTGYVVERRETEQSGADVLEVEAYSFDQFLRRNTVTNDQTGNTISEALADIIQTDTPVTYVSGNVSVGDEQELTRSYQGEPVEDVLRDLAFKSNNENFGVNDDLEFFFRPRETIHIDRGIDNTQWFGYDIPELGKEAINEVEVWFDDGERSVIIDDGTDKLDLQDNLNLPDPGTQRAELNRPLITNLNDAEDIGRKYLTFRNATLSGTVTTYGLFDAEPGDTIDITIDPRGIDAEFVIAATEYRWGVDQTILTIVEKRGDVDDILSEINDSVQRQEMETANRDAPKNRITTTNATAIVAVDVDADGTPADADRFVNDGRRTVRDTWTGQTPPDITTLVVGDDNSGLSRSNTSLVNQTNSATVTQSLPDAKAVEYSASITQTGVQEIGLETASGTLITRATFDSPTDINGTVTVTLTVSNDDSVSRGVLTNTGQTAVRDVLADNTPAIPDEYAYGSDDTPVAESDTALVNELVSVSLDNILIQSADAQADWEGITSLPDNEPIAIESGTLKTLQSNSSQDVLADRTAANNVGFTNDDAYNSGQGFFVGADGTFVELEFTFPYTIPAANVGIQIRDETNAVSDVSYQWDGTEFDFNGAGSIPLGWSDIGSGTYSGGGGYAGNIGEDIQAGQTYTLRIEGNVDGGDYVADVVSVYDDRYNYTFPNPDAATNNGGFLSGPELYPDNYLVQLATASTQRNVTEANFSLTAADVSNNFFVELANDGATYNRVDNSQTGSVTFAGGDTNVDSRINLSRYTTNASSFPTSGDTGQSVDDWSLFANPDAVVSDGISTALTRAVVSPGSITGSTVREAGIKGDSQLLSRHILAEFDVLSGQRISSSETTSFTSDN